MFHLAERDDYGATNLQLHGWDSRGTLALADPGGD
jgi:hypothetical protein